MEPAVPLMIVAFVVLWLIVKVGFVGLAVWLAVAQPKLVLQMHQVYQQQTTRCYLFGLVNGLLSAFIILLLISNPPLALLGFILLALLLAAVVAGYAVTYYDLGLRIQGWRSETNLLRPVLLGGVLGEAAFFTPLVGQILSLLVLFKGLGALIVTMLARRRVARVPDAAPKNESLTQP